MLTKKQIFLRRTLLLVLNILVVLVIDWLFNNLQLNAKQVLISVAGVCMTHYVIYRVTKEIEAKPRTNKAI